MSDNNQGNSGKRRRRRRRRSGKKNSGKKRSGRGRRSGKNSGRKRNSGNRRSGRGSGKNNKRKREKFGGREPVAEYESRSGPAPLTAFELFCLYYMGVTDDNRYKRPSMGDAARKLNMSPEDVELALRECGMDKHTIRDVDYDMSLAQLDVRVAPEGVDKREIARNLFDEFIEVNQHFVDKSEEELRASLEIER